MEGIKGINQWSINEVQRNPITGVERINMIKLNFIMVGRNKLY